MAKNYKETPWWWFMVVLVGSFVLGLIVVTTQVSSTPDEHSVHKPNLNADDRIQDVTLPAWGTYNVSADRTSMFW